MTAISRRASDYQIDVQEIAILVFAKHGYESLSISKDLLKCRCSMLCTAFKHQF